MKAIEKHCNKIDMFVNDMKLLIYLEYSVIKTIFDYLMVLYVWTIIIDQLYIRWNILWLFVIWF
jgi:hypothetical protein